MQGKWIRTVRKTYRVYLVKDDTLLASGTAEQCAEQMDISMGGFRSAVYHAQMGDRKKYRVEVLEAEVIPELVRPVLQKSKAEKPVWINEKAQLAMDWDKFCEPLRRKYGIQVKRDDG